jgi:hypothetical protein
VPPSMPLGAVRGVASRRLLARAPLRCVRIWRQNSAFQRGEPAGGGTVEPRPAAGFVDTRALRAHWRAWGGASRFVAPAVPGGVGRGILNRPTNNGTFVLFVLLPVGHVSTLWK